MSVEVKVPNLPESVSDATIAKWHKKPGDAIERDENLVDLETDKVVLEVPAPADGVLKDISAEEGETVTEGQVLGQMEEGEAPSKCEDEESEQEGGEKDKKEDKKEERKDQSDDKAAKDSDDGKEKK